MLPNKLLPVPNNDEGKIKFMERNRKSIAVAMLVVGALFAFGAYQIVGFNRAFGVKDHRVVQILESPDNRFKAELIRRHDFLDLNFFVQLNGEQIFRSEDFRPNNTVPFRETILWDTTGENLIFEIGGHRLFGYSLATKRKLSDKELLALKAKKPKFEDLF